MKRHILKAMAVGAVAGAIAFSACSSGTTTGGNGGSGGTGGSAGGGSGGGNQGQTITVTADITADTTWTTGNTYLLDKHVYVGNATGDLAGAVTTLTIQPGVVIKGKEGTSVVITRTGKINAVGTAAAPIIFTSAKAVGDRDRGDWGGVVLLGRGKANFSAAADGGTMGGESFIEGFPASGNKTLFGGQDEAWNCGTIKYARVEFAGYRLAPNNELNSITLGACGSGTMLDYVQVHMGLDDGIELFGGSANLKHAVISRMEDDGLDWDNGWSGKAQFVIVMQEPAHGASGIEADNDATGSNSMPRSNPEVWNATFIGRSLSPPATEDGNNNRGIHLRRNTAARMGNLIVTGFGSLGVQIESPGTAASFTASDSFIKNSIFFNNPNVGYTNDIAALADGGTVNVDLRPDGGSFDDSFNEETYLMGQANRVAAPGITLPLNLSSPVFKPAAGSAALSGSGSPPAGGFFDVGVTFVGAVGADDWTAGWTAYPNN